MDNIHDNYKYNNFYSQDCGSAFGKYTKGNADMLEEMTELIGQLRGAKDYNEIREVLANSVQEETIKKLDEITYQMGDYIIQDLLSYGAKPEIEVLKEMNKKGIKIAPELIDAINSGDYTILITKIDGLGDGELIPFDQGYNLLDDSAKHSAFKDMSKLAQSGVTNAAFFSRGRSALYITPEGKKVIIPSWKAIRPVDPNEKQDILNMCHQIIYKK